LNPDLILRARGLLSELRQMRGSGRVTGWLGRPSAARKRAKAPIKREEATPILRGWIAKNGRRLEGHPDYEVLSKEERWQAQPLGRYMPEAVQLSPITVETILGEVPESFELGQIGSEHCLRIPTATLTKHAPLLQWCKENAARIEGHPRYQHWDNLKVLGGYEAEALALPRSLYERLLGALPEGAEELAVYVGEEEWRHRRMLYKVRLNGKVSF